MYKRLNTTKSQQRYKCKLRQFSLKQSTCTQSGNTTHINKVYLNVTLFDYLDFHAVVLKGTLVLNQIKIDVSIEKLYS